MPALNKLDRFNLGDLNLRALQGPYHGQTLANMSKPGAVFTKLHFLRSLRIRPIS
jgi:hypothetical protein